MVAVQGHEATCLKMQLCPKTGTSTGLPASNACPCRCFANTDCSISVCLALFCFSARSAQELCGEAVLGLGLLGVPCGSAAGRPVSQAETQQRA